MSPVELIKETPEIGFPRVSGDEPGQERLAVVALVFSPRERG